MSRPSRDKINKFLPVKIKDAHVSETHVACLHPFTSKLNGDNEPNDEWHAIEALVFNRTWEHLGFISPKDENQRINDTKKQWRDNTNKLTKVFISKTSYDVTYIQWFLRQYQRVNDRIHIYGLCPKDEDTFSENAPILLSVKDEWFYIVAPMVDQEEAIPSIEALENEFTLLPPLFRDDIWEEVPDEEFEIIDAVVNNIVEAMSDDDDIDDFDFDDDIDVIDFEMTDEEPTFNPITGEWE
jgi:hypothetical protein